MRNKKQAIGLTTIGIWLVIIFLFSNSNASFSSMQSQFVVEKIINLSRENTFFDWLIFKLTERYSLEYSVRKLAHLTIFCVLQIITFFVLIFNKKSILKSAIYSMGLVVIYAVFDEIHQFFIPGRSCQIKDVFIDTLGGGVGLIISCSTIWIKNIFYNIKKRR